MISDIFISYARDDETRARELSGSLTRLGWSVWYDRALAPHQPVPVGRWQYDNSRRILQLEVSGDLAQDVQAMIVQITNWEDDDTAALARRGNKIKLKGRNKFCDLKFNRNTLQLKQVAALGNNLSYFLAVDEDRV